MSRLLVLALLVGCPLVTGCAATAAEITAAGTTLIGVACTLAADQTNAEPGWEIETCQVLDPSSGKPTGHTFQVKHQKVQALRVTP